MKNKIQGFLLIISLLLNVCLIIVTTILNNNIANIEETFNEYLIADKNSNNNSSEATIIISLTTGQTQTYIWLILTVIAIIGVGAFGTKKIISKDIIK